MMNKFLKIFESPKMAEDPVCHMRVLVEKPGGGTYDYKETTYYFCGPGCRIAFSQEPEAYPSGEKKMEM